MPSSSSVVVGSIAVASAAALIYYLWYVPHKEVCRDSVAAPVESTTKSDKGAERVNEKVRDSAPSKDAPLPELQESDEHTTTSDSGRDVISRRRQFASNLTCVETERVQGKSLRYTFLNKRSPTHFQSSDAIRRAENSDSLSSFSDSDSDSASTPKDTTDSAVEGRRFSSQAVPPRQTRAILKIWLNKARIRLSNRAAGISDAAESLPLLRAEQLASASSSNVEDVALGTANHSVVNDYDVEEPLRDVARTESISEEQLP